MSVIYTIYVSLIGLKEAKCCSSSEDGQHGLPKTQVFRLVLGHHDVPLAGQYNVHIALRTIVLQRDITVHECAEVFSNCQKHLAITML
ncbi:hypothetical protein QE152_g7290 [Popillia japonica]|uniref:Uncharacterized protein n=1 Tax=Popillia japonica TaxID=7064 RepID=A0AAW1MBU7_POPJA